jgi:hypothetical protein
MTNGRGAGFQPVASYSPARHALTSAATLAEGGKMTNGRGAGFQPRVGDGVSPVISN